MSRVGLAVARVGLALAKLGQESPRGPSAAELEEEAERAWASAPIAPTVVVPEAARAMLYTPVPPAPKAAPEAPLAGSLRARMGGAR